MKLSLPVSLKKMLANKNMLYIVFAIAMLQWLYLLTINRFDLIIVFGLIAFVIYKFNRNMILVLGVPFIIVLISSSFFREGFEDSATEEKKENDTPPEKKEKKENNKESSNGSAIITPTEPEGESKSQETPEPHNESETKDAVSNNEDTEFDQNQINYASTLTQNMKSYNDLLGSDGFAKMSQDTQTLLQQQEQLGNAMKQFAPLIGQMTPFLEKASGLLSNMDMKQINNMANMFKNK